MSSLVFIIPIVAIAGFSIYRYVKRQLREGARGCCDCPSHHCCQMRESETSCQEK